MKKYIKGKNLEEIQKTIKIKIYTKEEEEDH